MALAPDPAELLARARADLRMGVPVVLRDGADGALVLAAETARGDRLDDFRRIAAPFMVLTARRAETLKARCYDRDIARVALPRTAGIDWVNAIADPARDLVKPMKGPLVSLREGDAGLARAAIRLIKDARLLPAALLVNLPEAWSAADGAALTKIDMRAAAPRLAEPGTFEQVVSARLPLQVSQAGRLHVFRPADGREEHYAVEIGQPDRDRPVLARLHSACFTGDLLGSLKCDCGAQLRVALDRIGKEGAGVLLYLNQEGRGIGLANKMRAYSLQDQGHDTVEANHRLGFEDDERDFRIGAEILKRMGFSSVRLMTNNPAKVARMREQGLRVHERVPLKVGRNKENAAYLDTKARKSGHLL